MREGITPPNDPDTCLMFKWYGRTREEARGRLLTITERWVYEEVGRWVDDEQ